MTAAATDLTTRHATARERLLAQYAAIPVGEPVRLAKRTSNLFRPRSRCAGPGLDVTGLDRVLSVDPAARTADVQGMMHLRAPGRRDAAARADADSWCRS